MGSTTDGLDKLIAIPTGCGEQNMLKFAPNIFVMKYLEATFQLDDNIVSKAKYYMQKGRHSCIVLTTIEIPGVFFS